MVSKWKLPGESTLADGTTHPHHYIPGGYIFSPHNGDTGLSGHVYWTHYHAGVWITDHGHIWEELVWENGYPEPERGFQAISELAPTHTLGYYLPAGPTWIDDPASELGYDMADCWASCMIPLNTYAYIAGWSEMHIVDVTNPANTTVTGVEQLLRISHSWANLATCSDCWVKRITPAQGGLECWLFGTHSDSQLIRTGV